MCVEWVYNETNPKIVWRVQVQHVLYIFRGTSTEPVEYVVITFIWALHADARLLQQIMWDKSTHHCILENSKSATKLGSEVRLHFDLVDS